jgi:hypothetical protein
MARNLLHALLASSASKAAYARLHSISPQGMRNRVTLDALLKSVIGVLGADDAAVDGGDWKEF